MGRDEHVLAVLRAHVPEDARADEEGLEHEQDGRAAHVHEHHERDEDLDYANVHHELASLEHRTVVYVEQLFERHPCLRHRGVPCAILALLHRACRPAIVLGVLLARKRILQLRAACTGQGVGWAKFLLLLRAHMQAGEGWHTSMKTWGKFLTETRGSAAGEVSRAACPSR